jgi:hypothetical protein
MEQHANETDSQDISVTVYDEGLQKYEQYLSYLPDSKRLNNKVELYYFTNYYLGLKKHFNLNKTTITKTMIQMLTF